MYYAISLDRLYSLIDKNIQIIDLRDSFSFNKSHVKNSINISQNELASDPFSKNTPIILICYSGVIAKKEAEKLRLQGLDAYYLEDGFACFFKP